MAAASLPVRLFPCAQQHLSNRPDFCSVCGAELSAAADTPAAPATTSTAVAGAKPTPADPRGPARLTLCPVCQTQADSRQGEFCEKCGYNFRTAQPRRGTPPPAAPAADHTPHLPPVGSWELVVSVAEANLADPTEPVLADVAPIVYVLHRDEILVGRTSVRQEIRPDVALDFDAGVSHRHVRLLRQRDQSFVLQDLGSSNGTYLNGKRVPPSVIIPLQAGDRLDLGLWSRLTLQFQPDASPAP